MFALEICDFQFPMKTLRLNDEFFYDVTNVAVQRHTRKSEFPLLAVSVALRIIQ